MQNWKQGIFVVFVPLFFALTILLIIAGLYYFSNTLVKVILASFLMVSFLFFLSAFIVTLKFLTSEVKLDGRGLLGGYSEEFAATFFTVLSNAGKEINQIARFCGAIILALFWGAATYFACNLLGLRSYIKELISIVVIIISLFGSTISILKSYIDDKVSK